MPYIYAHFTCGDHALPLLSGSAARIIRSCRDYYDWGCQGPDLWFYHRAIPWKKGQSYKPFGNYMHLNQVEDTFQGMLNALMDAPAEEKDRRFAYFAGFCAHYALDSTAHPYILYKTEHHKYHTLFECDIDSALLIHLGKSFKEMPLPSMMPPLEPGPIAALHEAAARQMGRPLPEGTAREAIMDTVECLKWLYDPHGIKRPLVQAIERLIGRKGAFSVAIYRKTPSKKGIDPLNLAGAPWQAPWSAQTDSRTFLELLEEASRKAASYIDAVYAAAYEGAGAGQALEKLGALSFETGLDWRVSVQSTYYGCVYERSEA